MTLQIGVALNFSLQLDNHKPQHSDFGIVLKRGVYDSISPKKFIDFF